MSRYTQVSNDQGLTLEIINGEDITSADEPHPFLGGDSENPSWDEYLESFTDQYKPHVLLLKKCIEENGMVGDTGQDADDLWFKFSDGELWGFTWRAWGDLMQAIVNKKEGYMTYYM